MLHVYKDVFVVSPDQLFFDFKTKKWVAAAILRKGQKLQTLYGGAVDVEQVETIFLPLQMFVLSVKTPHIFAIGTCGIIAHNEIVFATLAGSGACLYGAPLAAEVMTPVVVMAVKGFSIALTTYASWIVAADILKNIKAWGEVKNCIKSVFNQIKAKFGNNFSKNPEGKEALPPTCGLQINDGVTTLEGPLGARGEYTPSPSSTCAGLPIEIPMEETCGYVKVIDLRLVPCSTSQQNKQIPLENEIGLAENDQVLLRKNPGHKGKEKSESNEVQKFPAGPHGTYEEAAYHGSKDNGKKSKAPQDGQAALDKSVKVKREKSKEKKSRIAIINNEIIVLYQTRIDPINGIIYHGYVSKWEKLHPDLQNALKKEGLVKNNGKIVKK